MAIKKNNFLVEGMSCTACSSAVNQCISNINGVKSATVSFADSTAHVEYNPEIISLSEIQEAVTHIGYNLIDLSETDISEFELLEKNKLTKMQNRTYLALALAIPVFIISMFLPSSFNNRIIMLLLTLPVFWAGRHFFINSWKRVIHLSANMDTLVALSTGIAFIFSIINTFYPHWFHSYDIESHVYFESACVIIALVMLGKLFETRARNNTSSAIRKLMKLAPKKANLLIGNTTKEVSVDKLRKGDILIVRPGEYVPLDGEITEGSATLDESMITGESLPIVKTTGSKVIGATLNISGSFRFKVTKIGQETLLAQIVKTISEAQASKAPVQQSADKIARIFVPSVLLISIITVFIWLLSGQGLAFALTTGITVLIISCPCALGLATPTALIAGIGKAAEHGILIKDAQSLELINKTNILILDKTGTLTEGKPTVDSVSFNEETDQNFAGYIYGSEFYSEHPLAGAIREYFERKGIQPVFPANFVNIPGKGISANFNNIEVIVGNEALFKEKGVEISSETEPHQQYSFGRIFASVNNSHVCTFQISDRIKSEAKEIIQYLKSQNIEIHLLSGDHNHAVAQVADELEIRHYMGEALPIMKMDYVEALRKTGKIVAMAGDGINDAPALAASDVGIAMGNGTDIAMETAGLTLIKGDLKKIKTAFNLSKQTIKTIHQNLFWAFLYNIIAIPIAAGLLYPIAGILLNPMVAALAMALSSVSVVSNSLRLKRKIV